jgi:hypothetical protein
VADKVDADSPMDSRAERRVSAAEEAGTGVEGEGAYLEGVVAEATLVEEAVGSVVPAGEEVRTLKRESLARSSPRQRTERMGSSRYMRSTIRPGVCNVGHRRGVSRLAPRGG